MKSDNATPHASGVYDVQVRNTIPCYDWFIRETIDLVRAFAPEAKVWLDTGAGTGNLVTAAYDLFPRTRFLLADPSEGMLELAASKLSRFDKKRVTVLQPADTAGLTKVTAERPDVITAVQSHHYLRPEGRVEATRTCYGLLADGGLYVTFENVAPFTEEGLRTGLARWGRFESEHGKSATDVAAHLARYGKEYFPITVEEHLELLRATGFRTVEILWVSQMQAGFWAVK